MTTEYFQLGGYRPHIQWYQSLYDDKQLAETVSGPSSPLRLANAPDSPLEIILGITPHGSSHLLLTVNQTRRIASAMRLDLPRSYPFTQRKFESLSPIYFRTSEDLVKKLATLKPKAKKSKIPGQSEDTSQANRGYKAGVPNPTRGAFEHGRTLYQILRSKIIPQVYGITNTTWVKDMEIYAFVYNTKGVDDRRSAEKLRNPHVLDIGICRATIPEIKPDLASAKHIIVRENSRLRFKGEMLSFRHGESKTVDSVALQRMLQDFFLGCNSPMVLLVNNAEETLNYIQNNGVDVSEWQQGGVKELLYPQATFSNSAPRDDYYRRQRNRSRSRSPPRNSYNQYNDKHSSSYRGDDRYRLSSNDYTSRLPPATTATRRPTYAPVYVVDVRQLYMALMQTHDIKTVVDIATRLNLPHEERWCAGNEAPRLIEVWESMVSGLSIDEQRHMRFQGAPSVNVEAGPSSNLEIQPQELDSDDEDQDPNFPTVKPGTFVKPPQAEKTDFFDESDYGSDSDDD